MDDRSQLDWRHGHRYDPAHGPGRLDARQKDGRRTALEREKLSREDPATWPGRLKPLRRQGGMQFAERALTPEQRVAPLDGLGDSRCRCDGTYDKTNLPDELIMSSYFSIRDDKIVSLTVIFNQPSPY